MTRNLKTLALAGTIGALLLAAPGLAAAQDTFSGNVISHEGDKLVVRSGASDITVMLTAHTDVEAVVGLTGIRREDHPQSDLINGLAINVETVRNGADLVATQVTFKPNDLKTALAIQAGTEQAKQRIIAAQQQNVAAQQDNARRISLVGQFDQIGRASVYFDTGSSAVSADGGQALRAIAAEAERTPGAVLRVVGYTDSVGSTATNQRLSDQRASAVTAYLLRKCNVRGEKILGAAGLGETMPDSRTKKVDSSRSFGAETARVTVFVLVSKAAQGTATDAAAN